jgi:hypothetical protein
MNDEATTIKKGVFLFCFAVMGFELRAYIHLEPAHHLFFELGIFEIGSHELFAWADFEPRSS